MGLEIPEEFWPITPIQTIRTQRTTKINHNNNENNKENINEDNTKLSSSSLNTRVVDQEEEECVTPKCEAQLLKTPLVCPPAPRKPRPAARKRKFSDGLLSPEAYFQIPISDDIDYVFMEVITVSSKKIKAG